MKEEIKKEEALSSKNPENPKGSTKKTLTSVSGPKETNPSSIGKSSKSKT